MGVWIRYQQETIKKIPANMLAICFIIILFFGILYQWKVNSGLQFSIGQLSSYKDWYIQLLTPVLFVFGFKVKNSRNFKFKKISNLTLLAYLLSWIYDHVVYDNLKWQPLGIRWVNGLWMLPSATLFSLIAAQLLKKLIDSIIVNVRQVKRKE